ncbi:hypothetical protein V2J09_023050 [Rumex salicifolius]
MRQCANEDQGLVDSEILLEIWNIEEGSDIEAEEEHLPSSSIQRPVITPSSTTPPRSQATRSLTCPPNDSTIPPPMMASSAPLPIPTAFCEDVPHIPRAPPVRLRRGRPVLPPVAPAPELERDRLQDWMLGGPRISTILPSCPTHIAHYIWRAASPEMIRHELRCHTRRLDFANLHPHIVDGPGTWWSIAHRSGISELVSLEYDHVDHLLIAAFVERWYDHGSHGCRPFVVDMITLQNIVVEEIRTWLEEEKIKETTSLSYSRDLSRGPSPHATTSSDF